MVWQRLPYLPCVKERLFGSLQVRFKWPEKVFVWATAVTVSHIVCPAMTLWGITFADQMDKRVVWTTGMVQIA